LTARLLLTYHSDKKVKKSKIIHITGHRGPSKLPYFLDNRITNGSDFVSLKRQPLFTPRKILGTHFRWRFSRLQDHSAAGRIRSIEKFNDLIGNRTRALP
jgi:hypothetical protein